MSEAFDVQGDVRQPWRRFVDEVAPLRPDLFRYCCGLTGSVWDGEDLVQDTLARVFSFLGKNHAALEHPRACLVRTATHLWIDRIRRAGLERTYAQAHPSDESGGEDPTQVLAVRAAANALFVSLPPQERAAVLLKDVLDFSLEQTSAMLKTSLGAVKSALHRGRGRLKRAQSAPGTAERVVPREVVDRFVAALAAKEFDAIRALCLEDVTVDMVGGANFETYEKGKITIEHAHLVLPGLSLGDHPNWRVAEFESEPIAIGLRTKKGVEGLNEIWRFEMGEGGVARLRLYCFNPEVLSAVAQGLGIAVLSKPYRSPM